MKYKAQFSRTTNLPLVVLLNVHKLFFLLKTKIMVDVFSDSCLCSLAEMYVFLWNFLRIEEMRLNFCLIVDNSELVTSLECNFSNLPSSVHLKDVQCVCIRTNAHNTIYCHSLRLRGTPRLAYVFYCIW